MSIQPEVALAILLMGVVSYACRLGGFTLMRFVPITPRVEAWLRAIPVALIGAILGPIAMHGGPAEWLGLAAAALAMRVTGNDLAAAVAAVVTVASVRAAGG